MTTTVEAASVRAYAQAIGDSNPAYPQSDDDVDGKIAPPSYAAVYALGSSNAMGRLGIAPNRLIHGEQSFEWTRAVRVGETLTVQGRIADVYNKRSLQFIVAETEARDAAGELVCVSRATVLVLPEPNNGGDS